MFFEIGRIYQVYPILLLDFDLFLNANQLSVSCRGKKNPEGGLQSKVRKTSQLLRSSKVMSYYPFFIHELELCLVT